MIFKQIAEIRSGAKTQTRRIINGVDLGVYSDGSPFATDSPYYDDNAKVAVVTNENGRVRYEVGKTYAVVPKRGQPAVKDIRIRITGIRKEALQDISWEDALAEGVQVFDPLAPPFNYCVTGVKGNWGSDTFISPISAYRALWNSINTAKGIRWEDNPQVWVLAFEVVKLDGKQRKVIPLEQQPENVIEFPKQEKQPTIRFHQRETTPEDMDRRLTQLVIWFENVARRVQSEEQQKGG